MRTVVEPQRDVPVLIEADVLVAGAGLAGLFAALSAARHGALTVLVDRFGTVGGNYGPGMGARHDLWQSPKLHDRGLGGAVGAFFEELEAAGGLVGFEFLSGGDNRNWRWEGMPPLPVIDNDKFQVVALRLLREAGVNLLLSTQVAGAVMQGERIRGVFVETHAGREAVLADVVIDSSGEADVAARAGARCDDSAARENPAIGLFFRVDGVDWERYEAFRKQERDQPLSDDDERWVREVLYKALGREWTNHPREILPFMRRAWESGEFRYVTETGGHGYVYLIPFGTHNQAVTTVEVRSRPDHPNPISSLDALGRSAVEAACRAYIHDAVAFHQTYVPGFENAAVGQIAPYMGSRYGRTIVADYTLTDDDVFEGGRFDDNVHLLTTLYHRGRKFLDMPQREEGHRFEVPLRALLPQGVEGLLAAGRSINTNQTTGFRWRWVVMVLGGVAGLAAALAARRGTTPRALDVPELQRGLLADGYYLGEPERLAELGLA